MASRLGWPACNVPVILNARYVFGHFLGPATVVAANGTGSLVVEFVHPVHGGVHQATANTSEVTPCPNPN